MFKYRLYKRPGSPIWCVGIGRKVRKSTKTSDEAAAVLYADALAERLWQVEKLGNRAALPFGETAEKWLNSTASDKTTDRVIVDWLLGRADSNLIDEETGQPMPNLTDESLSSVASADVWDQLREHGKAKGWTLSSIDRMMTTVSAVLSFARKRGDMGKDAPRLTLPKYKPPLKEPRYLTEEQFGALMAELPPHQRKPACFAVLTLLRMRAMLGILWARVDLKRRVAWIPLDDQKNGKTFRFALSQAAVEILEEIRDEQAAEYAAYVQRWQTRYRRSPSHPSHDKGMLPPPEHVFTYKLKPVDDFNTAAFKGACERAGVPWCTWHIMSRHTGASWGAQNRVTLEQRMKQGGWEDMRMAMRYSHLEEMQPEAAETVAQQLHTALTVKSGRRPKKASKSRGKSWSQSGSNRRPLPCHGRR